MRDFTGDVYTIWHCLVEDMEPLGEAEEIYYMGCPTCKKKMCEHQEPHVPLFLANLLVMTFDCKVQAKAIGSVVENILKIPATDCEPDNDGNHDKLNAALDIARTTPFNCKFIIAKNPQAGKNALEVVDVTMTVKSSIDCTVANMPSTMMKLVESDIKGTPPCAIKDVTIEKDLKILYKRAINTVQLLVTITDSGEERGCMKKDEDLVRITRKGRCILSGEPLLLNRTGELTEMSRFCKWNAGDAVYVIGRILGFDEKEKAHRIAMTADRCNRANSYCANMKLLMYMLKCTIIHIVDIIRFCHEFQRGF